MLINQNQNNQSAAYSWADRENLIKELELEKMPAERQEEIISQMDEIILKEMFLKVLERLDSISQTHFKKMLEEERTPEEIRSFLEIKIPDYEEMMKKIIISLKDDINKISKQQ